jgi:hypothetical protein
MKADRLESTTVWFQIPLSSEFLMLLRSISWCVIALCSSILLTACGSGGPSEEEEKEKSTEIDNLNAIQTAYLACIEKSRRPPKGPNDLKSHFPKDVDLSTVYTSTRDGQPYVIAWGVDPNKQMGDKPLVIAYEKNGKNGVRMVFSVFGVIEMSDEDFGQASFAPGIQP